MWQTLTQNSQAVWEEVNSHEHCEQSGRADAHLGAIASNDTRGKAFLNFISKMLLKGRKVGLSWLSINVTEERVNEGAGEMMEIFRRVRNYEVFHFNYWTGGW